MAQESELADRGRFGLPVESSASARSCSGSGGVLGGVAGLAGARFFAITTAMLTLLILAKLPNLKQSGYHLIVASRLAAIVAALFGGAVFGALGVMLAVPAYASLHLIVREVVFRRQDTE